MKSILKQPVNLCDKPFGQRVVIYDFVNKYGDWLFKQPLLLALQRVGYRVYVANTNAFLPIIPVAVNSKGMKSDFALAFTRSDLGPMPESLLRKHRLVLEIRREGRFFERVIVWKETEVILQKRFFKIHEQERIQSILKFFWLPHMERAIHIKPPQNKRIVVSFTVSENAPQRLSFNINEVIKVLRYLRQAHYTILYIKRKGAEDPILTYLPMGLVARFRLVETETLEEAFEVIEKSTYYFGSDSGLAHHATQNGNTVFALFNKQYHGASPLFSTDFFNHFTYFGDTKFSKEVIAYLRVLQNPQRFREEARNYLRRFITNPKLLLKNSYANIEKLRWLKLYLTLNSTAYKKHLSQVENLMNGVFFSDDLYEFDYDELKPKQGAIFIDSRKFIKFLEKSIRENLGKDYKKISIFAKNCSFFHGTCLKRRVSDIDSLLVSAHDLSKKHRKDVLQLVQSALERHSFSTQLPHQIPRIGNPENDRKKYHPILLKGEPSFSLKIHDDTKDVEKYQTRIKIKIILGELSHGDLLSLREKVMAEQVSWGEHFLKEIDELLEEKRFFEQYGLFIRKIETLLSCLGGFGVNANVILTINKEDTYSLSFILERLMRHGIIYINHDRLFINWDLRRPQHRWFIPITLAWKGKLPLEHITREALKGNIYTYPPFGILRNLSRNKIVPKRMIDLLSSESYLIIIEIFNALRGAKEQIRQPAHFSQEEIEDYVQIPNSNCEDVADRKLCLFGLLTGFAPKLSGQQIKLLARYNLFVQYLCHPSKIQIHKTRFFKRGLVQPTDSPKNFATKFKEDFTRALREYYLYQKCHLSQFLLEEKRKELLFMYFVRGRGLMEGPLNQSQEMQEFLCSIHLDTLFEDSVLTRVIIERFAYIVPDLSENYALFHVLKNLRMKQ